MLTIRSINLFTDWIGIVKAELENRGYSFTENDSYEVISIRYYNYLKRVIPVKPRQIIKSDIFNCPVALAPGLAALESKIQTGQDTFPHLSRKLKKLDERDDLLYDWGIYHLHLGTALENDGYMRRSGPVLFCLYDETHFYFLDVMPHGSWTKQELLRSIHRNWPHLIDDFRIKSNGLIRPEYNVTDDELGGLRGVNVNTIIEVEPGLIYASPGGGFTASGHSVEVMQRHWNNKENLEEFEGKIKADPEKLLKSVYGSDLSFISNPALSFKLVKVGGKYQLKELNNDFSMLLNF
ncbi:hypothetical protein VRU48_19110 [Pedobacter sp. KR3-3]|uniref:Uncharacterized protein n=1 Tax=Pedobacter albus TaxID=3113905 RepID=A0ABU7IDH4_9SPHI|nr:hypothetical protein [Pedobacter sp. KR3-3]MEE1947244.1 hypothetical protein [Pedobacter sp. KR3-3]